MKVHTALDFGLPGSLIIHIPGPLVWYINQMPLWLVYYIYDMVGGQTYCKFQKLPMFSFWVIVTLVWVVTAQRYRKFFPNGPFHNDHSIYFGTTHHLKFIFHGREPIQCKARQIYFLVSPICDVACWLVHSGGGAQVGLVPRSFGANLREWRHQSTPGNQVFRALLKKNFKILLSLLMHYHTLVTPW